MYIDAAITSNRWLDNSVVSDKLIPSGVSSGGSGIADRRIHQL